LRRRTTRHDTGDIDAQRVVGHVERFGKVGGNRAAFQAKVGIFVCAVLDQRRHDALDNRRWDDKTNA